MASSTPLNIKDPEVYQLARQLAALTGQTLTDTVRTALREQLSRTRNAQPDQLCIDKLREISDRCAARPIVDRRSNDELVGYDKFGIPK
jgi:antitoxin VapB